MYKYFPILFSMVLILGMGETVTAQKKSKGTATEEFRVEGVCKMCKVRIENAALIKGVKSAEWELESSIITVVYKESKISLDEIHQAIAKAGHRTDKLKADPEAYAKLPGCCLYDDGVKKH